MLKSVHAFNVIKDNRPCVRFFWLSRSVWTEEEPPPVRQIKKMPAKLTRLVIHPRSLDHWPSVPAVTELTVRLSEAKVTLLEVEDYFVREARSKSKGASTSKESNFYSRHLYKNWEKRKSCQDLDTFLRHFEERFYQNQSKIGLGIKRYEYVLGLWRLMGILESLDPTDQMNRFTEFCSTISREYNTSDLPVYLALHQLQFSQADMELPVEVLRPLTTLFNSVTPVSGNPDPAFPSSLQLINKEKALVSMDQLDTEPIVKASVLFSLSTLRWGKSNFSLSLDALSTATLLYLQQIQEQGVSDEYMSGMTVQLCSAWMKISSSACKQKMKPAIEYLVTQAEYFNTTIPGVGVLPLYVFYLAAREKGGDKEILKAVESQIPSSLWSPKFEKCFLVESMTLETKTFFLNDFVKNIASNTKQEEVHIPLVVSAEATGTTASSSAEDKSTAVEDKDSAEEDKSPGLEDIVESQVASLTGTEPAIQRELLDIKILEGVVRKDEEELLDLYLVSARNGIYPGDEATEALIQLFVTTNDTDSLTLLFRGSGEDSKHRELFYHQITSIQFQSIIKLWENEKRLEAWIQLVELYRGILSDRTEARILLSTSEELAIKCRKIAKLFIEENIDTDDSFLDAIRSGGLRVASEHRDVYFLLALWEGLFFSPKFESQEKAENMLEELPQLVKFLNIDPVITRAQQYNREELFRRIMELTLRHNATAYNKSRSFEALLAFQTEVGNLAAGERTIKSAKTLDIRITADYLHDFLRVKQEEQLVNQTRVIPKLVQSLKSIFKISKE